MKTLIKSLLGLLSLSLLTISASAQQAISGTIKDKETGEPLPYVNFGILGTSIGSASYLNGSFSLVVPANRLNDTITFSSIGYRRLHLPMSRIKLQEIIHMEKESVQLKEVVVFSNKNKLLTEGLTGVGIGGQRIESVDGGAAMAVLFNESGKEIFLQTASVFIYDNQLPIFKLRCRVLSIQNGAPADDLLHVNVITTSSQKKGKLSVDLSPYQLILREPFFVAFEWILDQPKLEANQLFSQMRHFSWAPPGTVILNGKKLGYLDEKGKIIKTVALTKKQKKEFADAKAANPEPPGTALSVRKSYLKGFRKLSSMAQWREVEKDLVVSVEYYYPN